MNKDVTIREQRQIFPLHTGEVEPSNLVDRPVELLSVVPKYRAVCGVKDTRELRGQRNPEYEFFDGNAGGTGQDSSNRALLR